MKKKILLALLTILLLQSCSVFYSKSNVYRRQSYRYSKCPTNDPINYFYQRNTGTKYKPKWVAPTKPYKSKR